MINRAHRLDDLKVPPNNKLEKLKRDLIGKNSIRINDQYRIIFEWDSDRRGALEVEVTDFTVVVELGPKLGIWQSRRPDI